MNRVFTILLSLVAVVSAYAQKPGQGNETITLSATEVRLKMGESTQVTCTYTGSSSLTWKSYDTSVATVTGDKTGCTITAVGEGSCYINVSTNSWPGASGSIYVYVEETPLTDADMPFIPTTRTGSTLAKDTHWYLITTRGTSDTGKYLFLNGDKLQCAVGAPYYDGTSPMTEYLWAFTGNLTTGYKIYNFATGGEKVVGGKPLDEPVAVWPTYEDSYWDGAYLSMMAPSEEHTLFRANRNGSGLTFTLYDEDYAGPNDYSSQGFLRFWDSENNLKDDGSRFYFYEVDPIDYGGLSDTEAIHETSVTLNKTSLKMGINDSEQLVATILPENASYQNVQWSSSNTNVASVSNTGIVTARAAGTATITATTHYGLTATAEVSVTLDINTEGLYINEVQASNVDQYLDPSYNYGGWIELYNASNKDMDLSGLFLTDTMDEPAQWPLSSLNLTYANYQRTSSFKYPPSRESSSRVPAKGYATIWFDHNDWRYPMMCPFKLDCDGGYIYVTDGANVLAECNYPESINRSSWARTTNGGDTWGWTAEPTLGESNATSTFATERLEAPVVSEDSQLFSSSLTVHVQWADGATLRYTTDGSTPSATKGQTSASGIFPITSTTILRFCAVQDGKLTSPVVTRSYIQPTYTETLPVMSLVTEDGNLYNTTYGIMTQGTNGRPGLGQSSACNWNMDWDRPANIELISKNGQMVFNQEANIAICGGWSRAYEPYSFKVKGKKQYEHMNYLPHQFFTAKPYIKNKTLQMRNGGNDNPTNSGGGRFKDAALQTVILSSGLNIDGQSYEPVHLYRNGKYAGLINMREPNNRDLVYSNYGYDESEVDQFEMDCDSAYVQSSGDREAFERWYELARNCSDPEVYEQVKQICDVEEFINYMAVQSYLYLSDYGYNNVKGYRPRVENGKFRFVLFDLDSASDSGSRFSWSPTGYSHNAQYEGTNGTKGASRTSIEVEYLTIFNNMLKNSTEFRKQFVDQFCILCGSVLEPERCAAVIDSLYNNVGYAAQLESTLINKSYLSTSSIASKLKSSYFTSSRISNALATMSESSYYYSECSGSKQTLSLSQNLGGGSLLYNDLPIPTGKFSGRIFSPVTLRAEAPSGYKFVGWKNLGGTSTTDPEETKEESLFDFGSNWSYYDQGSLDDTSWTSRGYTGDLSWQEGDAPLGYNTKNGSEYQTTLNYGGDSNAKYPTYYFRKYINLTAIPKSLKIKCHFDDGAAIYVNGKEVVRNNLPEGAKFDDYAYNYPSGTYYNMEYTLDPADFVVGTNSIAVEVHNNVPGSSDIYWDAAMTYLPGASAPQPGPEDTNDYYSTEAELTLPESGNFSLQAIYAPLDEEESSLSDTHPVKINEVSPANSIYVNDYYKKDDWVELYNTTDEDIDLTGYYISDNYSKPFKYQIPVSEIEGANIIPAHGYRLIWCSKRDRIGKEIHASFKLDNTDGAFVMLTDPTQTWCDTLTYQMLNGDETCGLFPDGASSTYLMQLPTISKKNQLTMYADLYDEHALEPEPGISTGIKEVSHSNELGLTQVAGGLLLTNEYMLPTTLYIYNVSGQRVMEATPNMSEGRAVVSTEHLPAGAYVARATDTDEVSVSIKFTIK